MEIKLGQQFWVISDKPFVIEITKIDVHEVEFKVSGEDVKFPERPRALSPVVFTKWLNSLNIRSHTNGL